MANRSGLNGWREWGKVALFLTLSVAFAIFCSVLVTLTAVGSGAVSGTFRNVLASFGLLLGLIGFTVIWYKDVHVFSKFGYDLQDKRKLLSSLVWGCIFGAAMQLIIFGLYVWQGNAYRLFLGQTAFWLLNGLLPSLVMHSCVAVSEELLFRGYLLERVGKLWNITGAVMVQVALFSFLPLS